jgi:hypothetical protein
MGYIIKGNQGLVVTRLTDVGRRKISQGNFNVSYFQVGDSEVNYQQLPDDYDFSNAMILEPPFNAQNNSGVPQSTKNEVKYPFYLQGTSGVTYGIPYQASGIDEVFNTASPAGFFSQESEYCFKFIDDGICINSQYVILLSQFNGGTTINLLNFPCSDSATGTITAGMKVAVWMRGGSIGNSCSASVSCVETCQPVLFYNVVFFGGNILSLDRPLPNFDNSGILGYARFFFYYGDVSQYDLPTPMTYFTDSVINYESICYPTDGFVRVWNLNIPWSESPAGSNVSNLTYQEFDSVDYLGTKEYYGYSSTGQTDTSGTWYYNSYGERIDVVPVDQKVIGIVHYTNNTIINWYGEKFACEVYDVANPGQTGQARNFQITIPWLSWHKNDFCCSSLNAANQRPTTFYIDPPGFDEFDLLTPHYIQSPYNSDMNSPGIRYFHLYDTNEAYTDGPPNRVGKVFPDDRVIVFDDEEIVAALSYASNRHFTLPAPRLGLINPGTTDGILNDDTECIWVTYAFRSEVEQGLHCNYYQKICGPSQDCGGGDQNVIFSFGGDFQCMSRNLSYGWAAQDFLILAQKTNTTNRPDPALWKEMDFTTTLFNAGFIDGNGFIDPVGMTSLSFTLNQTDYDAAPFYSLSDQVVVQVVNDTDPFAMNFGEESFFHGYIRTDIQATIYEMRYLINLPNNQFVNSSNPTWSSGITPRMTEIGLYDSDRNLLVTSKLQAPQIREGVQQVVVKLDF